MNKRVKILRKDVYNYLEKGFKVCAEDWDDDAYIFLNTSNYIQNRMGTVWPSKHQRHLREGILEEDKRWFLLLEKEKKPEVEEYVYKRKSLLNWKSS